MSRQSALPDPTWEPTRGFWEAAQREELAIPRCDACGRYTWYPAPRCAHCDAEQLQWTPVSGHATLFSWTLVTRSLFKAFADKTPYVTGLVALDEDPAVRLVTTLVDCDPEALHTDLPVVVTFRKLEFPGDETTLLAPMFTPRSGRRSPPELVAAEVLQEFWHSVGEQAFDRLVDSYFEEIRVRLASLPTELAAQRLDSVERLAHDLKTCAAALGGLTLRDHAAALEQASREGDAETARTIVAGIVPLGHDTLASIEVLRRTIPRS